MRLLLVNDDGFEALGLLSLANALHAAGHDICVVAPSTPKSGASQSMTFFKRQILRKIQTKPFELYAFDGSPADCVKVALDKLYVADNKPDFVLSGINSETNIGTEMYYSGTLGAAMEAAANKVRAAAFSLDWNTTPNYDEFSAFIVENLQYYYSLTTPTSPINVNMNKLPSDKKQNVVTFASENIAYVDYYVQDGEDECGNPIYMLKGEPHEELAPRGSDVDLYFKGYTTITPIAVGRTNYERLATICNSEKGVANE